MGVQTNRVSLSWCFAEHSLGISRPVTCDELDKLAELMDLGDILLGPCLAVNGETQGEQQKEHV